MPKRLAHARNSKRTKIVCTIGPASADINVIRRLILAGADIFRLNFSHGTHADHAEAIRLIRQLGYELSSPFAILADLSGPKLRIGEIDGGARELTAGSMITLTSETADGTACRFGVNFANFHHVARVGESILLDDGNFRVVVEAIDGRDVRCRVMNGGLLKSRKGVNLPDTRLPIPALTDKDIEDLRFALAAGVDLVALSFVRSPEDITQCREAMRAAGRVVPIIAKIEKKEAVDRLAAVLAESDGAMVARGDLGIEVPMEQVPSIQKRVITTCNRLAKPVIVATQMLESMIHSPRPTRAEVADIYNAILDGTDAIMLSAETASGKYPVEAVEVMDNVAGEAESQLTFWQKGLDWVLEEGEEPSITHVTCNSAVAIAEKLRLDLIIVPTVTGYSALHVSRFRPSVPVFACSGSTATVNALCLTWGVQARLMEPLSNEERRASETDALVKESIRCAREHGFLHRGQRALVIGGVPFGASHDTNYIQIVDVN